MKINATSLLFLVAGLVVVGLIGYVIVAPSAPSKYDGFAQCLTDKSVKMWGAWWCPHCANQKKLFGTSFKNVKYVECSPAGTKVTSQECKDAGIEGYPTWEFGDGSRLNGELTLETLSTRSGCPLPE